MSQIKAHCLVLSLCLLAALVLSGCAAPGFEKRDIVREPEFEVLLTKEVSDGQVQHTGFEHPWHVDEITLDGILSAVTFHYISLIGEKDPIAAFPTVMRNQLIPYLVEAFSKATPDEMVYFAYIGRHSYLYIAGKNYFTNGVMFVKNNRLNICFRYLAFEGPDRISDMPGAWRLDPRRKPQSTGWTLNEGPGMTLVRPSDTSGLFALKVYPNWIRIDLSANWQSRVSPKRRRKIRYLNAPGGSSASSTSSSVSAPARKPAEEEEEIIIRPPKGYFSIKQYPEMKSKE